MNSSTVHVPVSYKHSGSATFRGCASTGFVKCLAVVVRKIYCKSSTSKFSYSLPAAGCAPHLDHGLYEPQLRRWLTFFQPSQLLLVSFAGYVRKPAAVVRDVLLHAGLPQPVASD